MSFDDKTKFDNPASVTEVLHSIRQIMKNDLSTDNKILELTDLADESGDFKSKTDSLSNSTVAYRTTDRLNNALLNSVVTAASNKDTAINDRLKNESVINKSYNTIDAEIDLKKKSHNYQQSLTESVSTIQNLIDQVNYLQGRLNDKEAAIDKSENINTTTIDQLVKAYIKNWLETNLPKIASDLVEKEIQQLFSNYNLKK